MTTMTPTNRRAKLAYREQSGAVYRTKHAPKDEALWRDIVAGIVFFVMLLLGVAVVLVGGLIIFG
jgi:hypothetical protein